MLGERGEGALPGQDGEIKIRKRREDRVTSGPDTAHGHRQGPAGAIANKNPRAFILRLSAAATTLLQALTQEWGGLVVEHKATDQRDLS